MVSVSSFLSYKVTGVDEEYIRPQITSLVLHVTCEAD